MIQPWYFNLRIGAVVALTAGWILGIAPLAIAHEDIEEQIAALSSEIAKVWDDATLYARRGDLYRTHQQWVRALGDFQHALKLAPDLDLAILGEAQLALDRRQPAAALAILQPLLAASPRHGNGRLVEARAHAALGDRDAAIQAITLAIEHLPNPQPDHYLERADLFEHTESAIPGLDEGAVHFGELVSLHARALAIEMEHGRFDPALVRIERVRKKHGDLIPWLILRAEILAEANRNEDALAAWNEVTAAIERIPPRRRNTSAAQQWRKAAEMGAQLSVNRSQR